ncbi:MAG: ribosomal protection-like ABC-F family protein [Phycisphaerales bacterium]
MPILAATNLKHSYGDRMIIEGVSLSVENGERIGIVGRNGCGKSTLMKILTAQLKQDSGTVALQKGSRAGYLQQDHNLDPDETLRGSAEAAFAELHRLHAELDKVFEKMTTAEGDELDKLIQKQVKLEQQMEAAGGYSIDHKIEAVLHGLGFTDGQFSVKVGGLSGGQKGRLALARLLLEEPDVLLLDEPTNHLDIDGRLWLENFLTNEFHGAVIMVSHDRYLLDNVVNRIIEVEQGRLIEYPGNYTAFREIRAQRLLTQNRAFENQQTQFKKEEQYIMRYKAGQRARQAKGRETRLERAKRDDRLERPVEMGTMKLNIPKAERSGDMVSSGREISKSYTQEDGTTKVLFKDLDIAIQRGERWGIIGPNGAGKSTLVRVLLGEQPPDSGVVRTGSNVKLGHYSQTHEHVPTEPAVWQYLQGIILKESPGASMSEQAARDLAGAFMFSGPRQDRPMGELSGGERSRAVLAGLLCSSKNLLVLDEPTNHLDIPASERLEEVLQPPDEEEGIDGYEGSLLLISHDRALIDATCDHLIVLDGQGRVELFTGNYTQWHEKHTVRAKEKAAAESQAKDRRESEEKKRRAAEEAKKKQQQEAARPRSGDGGSGGRGGSGGSGGGNGAKSSGGNPLARMSTEKIEARIAEIEKRVGAIDRELAEKWSDQRACQKLGDERQRLAAELEPLEYEYFSRQG